MSCEEYLSNFSQLMAEQGQHNETEDPSQTTVAFIKYYFYGIGLPVVCAFGVLGNILNLIVLTRKQLQKSMDRMEKSAHLGLVALAVIDMLFCAVALPMPFVPASFYYTSLDSKLTIYFKLYHKGFMNIFLFCSNWLTVVMASARYLAICHPLHARGFINIRGTRIAIVCVMLLSVLVNLPRFWQYYVIPSQCATNCICYSIATSQLFSRHRHSFDYAYKITWAVLGTFIPIAILAFCNCCLIRALRQSLQMQRLYRANNPPRDSGHRITPTLIAIILFFIILACPTEILHFTQDIILPPGAHVKYLSIFLSATIITNFMQACNFAINFVLYCVINVHFRETMRYLLCCKWTASKNREHSNYTKASTTNQTYITDMETEM